MGWSWRRVWGWGVVVVAAVAVAVVSAVARVLPGIAAGAVAAAAGAAGGVWSARGSKALADDWDHVHHVRGELFVNSRGRVPRVHELADPVLVGVHPALAVAAVDPPGVRVPPFVRRDCSPELEDAVRRGGFVLLVGDSAAGKSRAALEAIRTCLPGHAFIRPAGRASMRAMLEAAGRERRCVLWLDNIERFLGAGGLTVELLSGLLGGEKRHVVILATMRAQERARYSPRGQVGGDPGIAEAARSGLEVLEAAVNIRVRSRWTPAELDRAQTFTGDERISAALQHADRLGVAEYLAAGPQLLADWRDGWAPGTHPRGAALVAAAVDARRAGYRRGLPPGLLRQVHEHYLLERGGAGLRPEGWDEALAWAVDPLQGTSSSLLSHDDEGRYRAFDYLPDAVDSGPDAPPVPEPTWRTLIEAADPGEADDIGWSAYYFANWASAQAAFRKALAGGRLMAADGLAYCLGEAYGQAKEAADVLRAAIATAATRDDIDQADLFRLRAGLSWWTGQAGHSAEALRVAQDLVADSTRILGAECADTLWRRILVVRWTGETGDVAVAQQLARDLVTDCVRLQGSVNPVTLSARFDAAMWTGRNGDAAGAVQLLRELETDLTDRRPRNDRSILDTRANLASWLLRADDTTGGLELARRTAADYARAYGSNHSRTLEVQIFLAGATGRAGRPAEALRLATNVAEECARSLGASNHTTLHSRYVKAIWTGESGNLNDALAQFEALLADASRDLGPDHEDTLDIRSKIADLTGRKGDSTHAARLYQSLIGDRSRLQGPHHPRTEEDRKELHRWQDATTRSTGT